MNPISGMPLSATHSSEIARTWSVIASGALLKVIHSAVMPTFAALFSAVRTSCHFLPVNTRPGNGNTVSSATCTELHPSSVVTRRASSVTLYRHGVHPRLRQNSLNPRTASALASRTPKVRRW